MTKEARTYDEVKIVYLINGVGNIGQRHAKKKKKKLEHLFILYTRKISKWIKDLNVRLETIKILEENRESKISDISCNNIFSDLSPQSRETKEKH